MKKSFVAAALLAGLVGPASAATTTLDFTTGGKTGIGTGNLTGWAAGTNYTISGAGGTLIDATHGNSNECGSFVCADVGFGIDSGDDDVNDNEIDLGSGEYVVVTFDSIVKILGFAGMLTYFDSAPGSKSTETVVLEYYEGGIWKIAGEALAAFSEDHFPGSAFYDTVGLAVSKPLSIFTNKVRFTASGGGDQGDSNVTAAGLIVAPVPVPASLPLLLAGIGALGFAARRKRKSA